MLLNQHLVFDVRKTFNSPILDYLMSKRTPHIYDFTILKELGKGAFGTVFLVRQNSDGLEVCLKSIKGASRRIQREAEMLSEINNKKVIKYSGSFAESGTFNIVMEDSTNWRTLF